MIIRFEKDVDTEINPVHILMARVINNDLFIFLGSGASIKAPLDLNPEFIRVFNEWCMSKEFFIKTEDSVEDGIEGLNDVLCDIREILRMI